MQKMAASTVLTRITSARKLERWYRPVFALPSVSSTITGTEFPSALKMSRADMTPEWISVLPWVLRTRMYSRTEPTLLSSTGSRLSLYLWTKLSNRTRENLSSVPKVP